MKAYHEFQVFTGPSIQTEKSFALEFRGGYTAINDWIEYFPKSQCIFTEPNDIGNFTVLIPVWMFARKKLNPYACLSSYIGTREF